MSESILSEADRLVNGPRQAGYGHPSIDFHIIAQIWSQLTGYYITPAQVGLCMAGLKLAREAHAHKRDNLVDTAGYAQTVQMVLETTGQDDTTKPMIYLASPYSHPKEEVRTMRFNRAVDAVIALHRQGKFVFSPIVHSHPLALCGLGGTWKDWAAWDEAFMRRCSSVLVLQLDGWQHSVGVQAEIEMAARLGKMVAYLAKRMI